MTACKACGRVIPEHYLTAAVDGMHPGCYRRLAGLPRRGQWDTRVNRGRP